VLGFGVKGELRGIERVGCEGDEEKVRVFGKIQA